MTGSARAHVLLRRDHIVELLLGGLTTYVAARCLLYEPSMRMRLFWLAAGGCILTATIGVWFAREWARLMFALLSAIAALGFAWQVMMILTGLAEGNAVGWIAVTLLWGEVARRMFRRSTRDRFAASREAITHIREASA